LPPNRASSIGQNGFLHHRRPKPSQIAWYHGDPADYPAKLNGARVLSAHGLRMFVEIMLSTCTLLFNDGDNLRPSSNPTN